MIKNPRFFKLPDSFDSKSIDFETKLNNFRSTPLRPNLLQSIGWYPVFFEPDDNLIYKSNNAIFFKLHFQDKVIPSQVVNEMLDKESMSFFQEHGEEPMAAWKKDKKIEIINSLLPQAFIKSTYIWAYIDLTTNLLIIDAGSEKKAETLIDFLMRSVESQELPVVVPWNVDSELLTSWVKGTRETFDSIDIDDECQIKIHDKGVVKCTKIDLTHESSLDTLYNAGEVVSLCVSWGDGSMIFTIDDTNVMFKSVKINEMPKPSSRESIIEGFIIYSGTIREVLPLFSNEV